MDWMWSPMNVYCGHPGYKATYFKFTIKELNQRHLPEKVYLSFDNRNKYNSLTYRKKPGLKPVFSDHSSTH